MKTKKIDKCLIEFACNRFVFYPGENVEGTLHLHMNRSMDMEAIEISLKGKVKTEWEQTVQTDDGSKEIEYESKDKLFEAKQNVFGNGKQRQKHDAGENSYPFCINLPKGLPSSYEGHVGYIRYELKVEIKKSWKDDLKLKKMFVVNELLDSNQGIYKGGPGDNDEKTLGCLCCASGPLVLSANLDRAGYCPGESILITANVANNTSREMNDLKATLVQKVEFQAKCKESGYSSLDTRSATHKIAHVSHGKIAEGETIKWENKPLMIPPSVPSLSHKLINIKYFVEVELDVPMGIDLDFKLPITMTTVPFIPAYGVSSDGKPAKEAKHAKIGPPPVALFGYPDMIPHVYASILDAKDVKLNKKDEKPQEKDYDEDKYTPVYAYAVPGTAMEKSLENPVSGSRSGTPQEALVDNEMPPIV